MFYMLDHHLQLVSVDVGELKLPPSRSDGKTDPDAVKAMKFIGHDVPAVKCQYLSHDNLRDQTYSALGVRIQPEMTTFMAART